MNTFVSAVFWGVITFSLLVVLHEGGHFLAARIFGVKVHEFMVGLPGPAIRVRGKRTTYGVTAVPLGGYVRIAGMEPGPEDPLLEPALAFAVTRETLTANDLSEAIGVDLATADGLLVTLADWDALEQVEGERDVFRPRITLDATESPTALLDRARSVTYRALPTWKRVTVLLAGVAVNLLTALLVFTIVIAGWGYYRASLTIAEATPGKPAAVAGIRAGDKVASIDGVAIKEWQTLLDQIAKHKVGDTVKLTVTRDGRTVVFPLTLAKNDVGRPVIGIAVGQEHYRPSLAASFGDSFRWMGMVFKAIGGFFNPSTFKQSVSQSTSVIGVSVIVSEAARTSAIDYAWVVALLSLSLGAMNVLPIPPLDGGKIALELLERLMGRPLPRNLSLGLSAAGTLLLFALIGYLMYSDVLRYVVNPG